MTTRTAPVTLTLDRRLLEHPRALHLRRMRTAIFLYLDLLARLPAASGRVEVIPAAIATDMGLPEGTIWSWLGHLRRSGYIVVKRLNGSVLVEIPRSATVDESTDRTASADDDTREFTLARVQRALGENLNTTQLADALDTYPTTLVRRALAGALAPKDSEIRRSRTALFLYLLRQYVQQSPPHDSRA